MTGDSTRFPFGANWLQYADAIDESRIERAQRSLMQSLKLGQLTDRSFLDLGSGSGLFSLAAWRLGASVCSVDLDPQSVQCTQELRKRFADGETRWQIHTGSALDKPFLDSLGSFNIVYSWGVLHHTGDLWTALENTLSRVDHHGHLLVAIYNDQGRASVRWKHIKRLYNLSPSYLRPLIVVPSLCRIWGPTTVKDLIRGKPFFTWRTYESERGMDAWHDLIDWVGGFPFEVATPDEVSQFCFDRGLQLTHLKTCGTGRGCNEFVFVKERGAEYAPEDA